MKEKTKRYGILVIWGMLLFLLSSCAQQAVQLPPLPPEDPQMSQNYLIGPEDVVEVMVWKNADLSRVVNVRPDGKISLPLIGDVEAAGLTAVQLTEVITEKLKEYYKEPPEVSVILQQVNSYAIYMLGEIRHPGRIVVRRGTTFLHAITLAGGFTEFASTNKILVRRRDADHTERVVHIRYRDIISGNQDNLMLKPGDIIIIP